MPLDEIVVLGAPALLIPCLCVAKSHQYHNALKLAKIKAAEIMEEELTGEMLIEKVERLINDKKLREQYSQNLKRVCILEVNEKIYKEIKCAAN